MSHALCPYLHSDPSSDVAFSDVLYDNDNFAFALSNALNENGILVSQVGETEDSQAAAPPPTSNEARYLAHMMNHGFTAIKDYEEAHGGFLGIWRFWISFKDAEASVASWYADEATIQVRMRNRMRSLVRPWPEYGVDSVFRYMDSATLVAYQFPSRSLQTVFCRSQPTPVHCNDYGLDPFRENVPLSAMEVRTSTIPKAGRGVFINVDEVKAGSYYGAEESVHSIDSSPATTECYQSMLEEFEDHRYWSTLHAYMHGYGFAHEFYGLPGYAVEPSILTFVNHGCERSYNVGPLQEFSEATEGIEDEMPAAIHDNEIENTVYSPLIDRTHWLYNHGLETFNRDLKRGDEVFDNYLNYYTVETWREDVLKLRAQCVSGDVGDITKYENNDVDAATSDHQRQAHEEL